MSTNEPIDLLGSLHRALLTHDPMPLSMVAELSALFGLPQERYELAEFRFDSRIDADEQRGPVMLTAVHTRMRIHLRVMYRTHTCMIAGECDPPAPLPVRVETPHSAFHATADEAGRFVCDRVPTGPVRVRVQLPAGGAIVKTDWVTL